eukprot:1160166-Pelagomonas_calceolata.AAC.8
MHDCNSKSAGRHKPCTLNSFREAEGKLEEHERVQTPSYTLPPGSVNCKRHSADAQARAHLVSGSSDQCFPRSSIMGETKQQIFSTHSHKQHQFCLGQRKLIQKRVAQEEESSAEHANDERCQGNVQSQTPTLVTG